MTELTQAVGFYRRRVGDVVVTALNDGVLDLPPAAMRGVDADTSAALLRRAFRAPSPRSSRSRRRTGCRPSSRRRSPWRARSGRIRARRS